MTLIALLGAKALFGLYLWLGSAIVASYLSDRKGYGEKPGLVTGLLISVLAPVLWLVVPAKQDSRWKLHGPFGGGGSRALGLSRPPEPLGDGWGHRRSRAFIGHLALKLKPRCPARQPPYTRRTNREEEPSVHR